MAKLVVLDDNPSARNILTEFLSHEGYKVSTVRDCSGLEKSITGQDADLLLIHKRYKDNSGWTGFNRLKRNHRNAPALLYFLPDYRRSTMAWIVKAVEEALYSLQKTTYSQTAG